MPKFLITASYTTEGVKGLLKNGGSARRAIVQKAAESVGGKLEAFVLPVALGSAARAFADGPTVTIPRLGLAGAAADFCSGLSAAGPPDRDGGIGGYGARGSARPT